jgi:hypothetical protein
MADPSSVTPSSLTLAELVERGTGEIAHYRGRARPPATPLEWLGIAVTQLPELSGSARTVDDLSGRARSAPADIRASLLRALSRELGAAAATIGEALRLVTSRYPSCDAGDTPEAYSSLVEPALDRAPRRSEMTIGAYASFLGGAIEAAGALVEAELGMSRAPRWDRADHEHVVEVRAEQLCSALTNAQGGLLAYARLLD